MSVKIRANEIKMVKVEDLKSSKKNKNKHGQDQIEMLSKHYDYQGFRVPLIVSNLTGEVVSGNGRLLAAKRHGIKELPVIFQDFDSVEQEYAFLTADNALSKWSELDMSGINADVVDLGPDFNIEHLGIMDFTLDKFEKTFDPDLSDEKEPTSKTTHICPECGNEF
jgi:hypothetical protein